MDPSISRGLTKMMRDIEFLAKEQENPEELPPPFDKRYQPQFKNVVFVTNRDPVPAWVDTLPLGISSDGCKLWVYSTIAEAVYAAIKKDPEAAIKKDLEAEYLATEYYPRIPKSWL